VRWRKQYRQSIRDSLDKIIFPALGGKRLDQISRADVLGFRAEIAKRRGRGGQTLSGKRINKLMALLKAILDEACDRFTLDSPARGIKALKQKRAEVCPFTLDESDLLVSTVRKDYQPYLTVRLLTGLRTGEANGLKWCDVDFDGNLISVERTVSRAGDGDTKTEGSKRLIPMVPQVRTALEQQKELSLAGCEWVFHTMHGHPIDAVNFTNRVWYPLLRHLGLKLRPPYQMRHTSATLMLASGENPEWVAKILGHSTTEMLFRVYSRFVPNLTRNDGRAYAGLLNARHAAPEAAASTDGAQLLASMTPEQKRALLIALAGELSTSDGGHGR
jgi:integrase